MFMAKAVSRIRSIAVVAAALVVSACGTPPDQSFWSGAASPKVNKISLVTLAHDVEFEGRAPEFLPASRRALDGFMRRLNIAYGDRVYVVAGADLVTPLGMERARVVRTHLLRRGYPAKLLEQAEWAGRPARPGVRIVVHRFVVTTPRCPDWRKDPHTDDANSPSSNFGCANAVNLGLMVADPRDIVSGNETGAMDGERAAAGVKRYRDGKEYPLLDSGTTK